MALKHELILDIGVICPVAYARISGIQHTHAEVVVNVEWWSSQAARLEPKPTIKSHSFSIPWQETMSLAAAYTALKSEPIFSGAEDI